MSKKSSRPYRPAPTEQPINPDDLRLEGNVPTPDAPKRITLALYFTHGHILTVTVDAYMFQRNTKTQDLVGWEFRGMSTRLGFSPQDLVAYAEIGIEDGEPVPVAEPEDEVAEDATAEEVPVP